MTEDFYVMFNLDPDNKHVAATDMASIAAKELQKKTEVMNTETQQLRNENTELKKNVLLLW